MRVLFDGLSLRNLQILRPEGSRILNGIDVSIYYGISLSVFSLFPIRDSISARSSSQGNIL